MSISWRCLLGHKWESYGYQDMVRRCDNKVIGALITQRCTVCGKLNRVKLA